MRDLVFVSMEDWDEVWRRNQFICAGLARRHPGMKILFVGLPRNAAQHLRRRELRPLLGSCTFAVEGLPNVTVTRPLRLGPETYAWGRRLNEVITRRHVAAAMARLGISAPVLWLNPQSAVHMVGRMGEAAVVYDITDDWTAAVQPPEISRRIAADDDRLCRRSDAVIVCSQRLFEMKRSLTRNLHLIPNGVEVEHYADVARSDGALPAGTEAWQRPVLGYMGTIHSERVDVDLVCGVAERLERGTVALVGPSHLLSDERDRLERTGRVVFTGAVPYSSLPAYVRAFDVCITPHCISPFTESLNPIKLWEYMAAGKPIVTTPVAGFRDYPELVELASDSKSFVDAALRALQEGPQKSQDRRRVAREHSWDARLNAVERVLEQCTVPAAAVPRQAADADAGRIGTRK